MDPLFQGMFDTMAENTYATVERNRKDSAAQLERETAILKALMESGNEKIRKLAMAGMIRLSQGAGKSKGGIIGKLLSAPPEEIPELQQIDQIANLVDQLSNQPQPSQPPKQDQPLMPRLPGQVEGSPTPWANQSQQFDSPGQNPSFMNIQPPQGSASMPPGDMVTNTKPYNPPGTYFPFKGEPIRPDAYGMFGPVEGAQVKQGIADTAGEEQYQRAQAQENALKARQQKWDLDRQSRVDIANSKQQNRLDAIAKSGEEARRTLAIAESGKDRRHGSPSGSTLAFAISKIQSAASYAKNDARSDAANEQQQLRMNAFKTPGIDINYEASRIDNTYKDRIKEIEAAERANIAALQASRPPSATPTDNRNPIDVLGDLGTDPGKAKPKSSGRVTNVRVTPKLQ